MQLVVALWLSVIVLVQIAVSDKAYAEKVTFIVSDQQGNPVRNAVILGKKNLENQSTKAPAIMDQINKDFQPHVLTIQQGRYVNFPNSDHIRHHVYSFSRPKVFEIKLYAKAPKEPLLFDQAGIVVLGCNIHDSMIGYIIVSDTPEWGQTNESGQTTLDFEQRPKSIRIWHPTSSQGIEDMVVIKMPTQITESIIPLQLDLKLAAPAESNFKNHRFKQYGR